VLREFRDRRVKNPVVITGDIHQNWAAELAPDFDQPDAANVAVEFVGTSISSAGDGVDQPQNLDRLLAENPWVKYHNCERGYVRCEVSGKTMRADYRTVPYITRPGAPLNTRASFVVENGRPRLQRV
jgi:alkaline phosphatase D